MAVAWRIVRSRYADSAFDGAGARRVGGRFNSRGTGVVYCADSLALAILEVLVHVPSYASLGDRVAFRMTFDDDLVESLGEEDLPADWRSTPASRSTQLVGDAWVDRRGSAILRVPSVIVPQEYNLILNPAHPGFDRLDVSGPHPLRFDPRLEKPAR